MHLYNRTYPQSANKACTTQQRVLGEPRVNKDIIIISSGSSQFLKIFHHARPFRIEHKSWFSYNMDRIIRKVLDAFKY